MYWVPKMHKNPTGAHFIIASKYVPQNKFLNLFPMSLHSQIENFHKNTKFYQIITSFGSYKILTPSFNH